MIHFANAGWFWALLGLAIPLAIHLLNASSGRRTVFPALKFAAASQAQRVRHIALREPWLLALRLVLLTLLIGWLAGPSWQAGTATSQVGPVLVSPLALQLHPVDARNQAVVLAQDLARNSSLAQNKSMSEPQQLAAGFPVLDEPALYVQPATEAMAELLSEQTNSTTVFVADHPLDRQWLGSAVNASVTVKTVEPTDGEISVALSVSAQRTEDARFMRAALAALASRGDVRWQEVTSEAPLREPVDVWISLGKNPLSNAPIYKLALHDSPPGSRWSVVTAGGEQFRILRSDKNLVGEPLYEDQDGRSLVAIRQWENQSVIQFAGRFEAQSNTLVGAGIFPDLLFQWLSLVRSQPDTIAPATQPPANLWWALFVLVLWVAERGLAVRAKRPDIATEGNDVTAS